MHCRACIGWAASKQGSCFPCCAACVSASASPSASPPQTHAQDLVLFNDTIYYNIRYGRLGATREEVEEAAKQVGGAAAAAVAVVVALPLLQ